MSTNNQPTEWQTTTVDQFDFGHQKRNYQLLLEKGITFHHVEYKYLPSNAGVGCYYNEKYRRAHGHYPPPRLTFKVYNQDGTIIWHKHESPLLGGGRNSIIINDQRQKLSTFLSS